MNDVAGFSLFGCMTPKEIADRNHQKRIAVLCWLARYSHSIISILAALLNIDERNARALMKKMESEDLLRSEILPSGQRLYGLTPSGIAQLHASDPVMANIARPYQAGRVPLSTLAHNCNIQMAEISLSLFGWTDFIAGRDLYIPGSKQVPDVIANDPNGLLVALEIELHVKSSKRMKVICENYSEVVGVELDPCTLYQRVLYLSPFPDRINRLLDEFVPSDKRAHFEVDVLHPLPLNLTPRRIHRSGELSG